MTGSDPSAEVPGEKQIYPNPNPGNFTIIPQSREVGRTITGLTLMIVGLALSWIPYVQYLGSVLEIIGFILILLGKNAFASPHPTYAQYAMVLFIVSIIGGILLGLYFAASLITTFTSSTPSYGQILSIFSGYTIGLIVIGIISGISVVLLVLGISNGVGRILLYAGLAATVVAEVVIYLEIIPRLATDVQAAIYSSNTAPLLNDITRIRLLGLLDVIPVTVTALAYYMARKRIVNREIP